MIVAALVFDVFEYMQQLEAAGMPREQAEVVAKGTAAVFVHNFDALVTKDYLDTRFEEFETRIDARIEKRISQLRFETNECFASVDRELSELRSNQKLHTWILSVLVAVNLIPLLREFLAG